MHAIKFYILILFTLASVRLQAQTFEWEAELPVPESSGFYRVFLAPQITSKLKRHYPDIRIYNSENQEVPFLYQSENIRNKQDSILSLHIIKKKHRLIKSYTSVVIKNDSGRTIDNFAFLIDNSGFRKWLKISAGNHQGDWYVLKDNFPAQTAYSDSSKAELIINNIPESNFRYYEIIFYDYDNQSVNVHKAYSYRSYPAEQNYVKLPPMHITHTDTMERTIVKMSFDKPQFVDRIQFDIKGPNLFFRNAVLEKPVKSEQNEGKLYYDELNKQLTFSSEKPNTIRLSHFKIKELNITIDNRNNQPLRITKATAWQQKSYLTAYLNAQEKYTLKFGSSYTDFPVYDLEFFKEKIPENIPVLHIQTIKQIHNGKAKFFSSDIWNMPVYYLWTGMGLLGAVLLYLTAKMLFRQYRSSDD